MTLCSGNTIDPSTPPSRKPGDTYVEGQLLPEFRWCPEEDALSRKRKVLDFQNLPT